VPKTANVHYLRTFINGRFSNSKESIFLFCYGSTLNNNETMESIYKKFKAKINERTGIEIQVASMASF
jgi:Zn-dependent M16 (insulinase) family peptidase